MVKFCLPEIFLVLCWSMKTRKIYVVVCSRRTGAGKRFWLKTNWSLCRIFAEFSKHPLENLQARFICFRHQEFCRFFVKSTETFLQLDFGLIIPFWVKLLTTGSDKQHYLRRKIFLLHNLNTLECFSQSTFLIAWIFIYHLYFEQTRSQK